MASPGIRLTDSQAPLALAEQMHFDDLRAQAACLADQTPVSPEAIDAQQVDLAWALVECGLAAPDTPEAEAYFAAAESHAQNGSQRPTQPMSTLAQSSQVLSNLPFFRARRYRCQAQYGSARETAAQGVSRLLDTALAAPVLSEGVQESAPEDAAKPYFTDQDTRHNMLAELAVQRLALDLGFSMFPSSPREAQGGTLLGHSRYILGQNAVKLPLVVHFDTGGASARSMRANRINFVPVVMNVLGLKEIGREAKADITLGVIAALGCEQGPATSSADRLLLARVRDTLAERIREKAARFGATL